MSDTVTALKGAKDESGFASISEAALTGMITLRGDLSSKAVIKAALGNTGLKMPEQRHCVSAGSHSIAWMSPDELLILCPYGDVQARLADLQEKLVKEHALAVNVSDARAMFRIRGTQVRDVVAKLAPVDMHPEQFTPGMFRRTRFAQVPAAFWMPEPDLVQVICFRSVAQYMFDLLSAATRQGSEVGHF